MIESPAQGSNEIEVHATPEEIWNLLGDSVRLPEYMPVVKSTTGGREAMGAIRECAVDFDGRLGQVTERCVVYDYPRRIGWQLVSDSLGFSRILSDFSFDFVLVSLSGDTTRVVNTSYYRPRGLLAKAMVALVIRRKFRQVRERVLANLKRLAEESTAEGKRTGARKAQGR